MWCTIVLFYYFLLYMKLVSILICTYNAGNTIKQTLQSCLNQSYSGIEILIHDDQSKDNTLDVINSIWDKRIKIVESWKKLWPYKGLNFLLDNAKWDYIAIQDHDDLWHPEKIEKQVKFLEENEKCVWCWTKTLMWYEWDNKWFEYYLWKENYYTIHPSLNLIKRILIQYFIYILFGIEFVLCYLNWWEKWFILFYTKSREIIWLIKLKGCLLYSKDITLLMLKNKIITFWQILKLFF